MSTRTYRALLVANSTFPADPHNLAELEGPRNDPALLRDALCDRDTGLVPSDNVRLVTERTMAEVLRELEDFLRAATRQDTLILYYSGHGLLDQSNELFLCTRDTRSDRLRSTAVKASDVRQMIDESAAATTVILLDCCHSGRFKSGGDLPGTLAGRGRFVVTSSRGGELANDTNVRNHASLFTHHLVEGLRFGAPDRDNDGIVNLSEVYDYVHASLGEAGRQVPQKRFEGDGDVPIALRTMSSSAHPQPGLLDPVLVQPELDVPDSVIDLGEVDADEELPPERLAVINRGGGSLQWTVESSADWCVVEAEEGGVLLRLSPRPGPNRANVYVRDSVTGAIKTVRVSVRVRQPAASTPVLATPPATEVTQELPTDAAVESVPEVVPEPPVEIASQPPIPVVTEPLDPATEPPGGDQPPPEAAEGAEPALGPRSSARDQVARWLPFFAAGLAIVAGIVLIVTGVQANEAIRNYTGYENILRNPDDFKAPGMLNVLLGAGLLAVAGLAAFLPRLQLPALGAAAALAVPLGFERLREHGGGQACECVGPDDGVSFFRGAAIVCLLAGVAAAAALWSRRAWLRTRWLPTSTVIIAVAAAAMWGGTTLANLYDYYDDPFGAYGHWGGTGWQVIAVAAVIAGIVAAAYAMPEVGAWTYVGAIMLPVCSALTELIFVVEVAGEDGYSTAWMTVGFGAVSVLVWLAVRVVLRSRRGDSNP